MSRTLTRVVCIGSVVAAGSCGFATEPLLGIFRQAEQDGRETVTVQPGRIYSSGATGFLVACPYLPRATVEDSTGTRVRDIPDSGLQEGSNALVITYPRGKVSVQRFARSAVDFCSRGAPEPVIHAIDDHAVFVHHDGTWVMESLGNSRTGEPVAGPAGHAG